jgi:hypothetical protein
MRRPLIAFAACLIGTQALASPGIYVGEAGGNHSVTNMYVGTGAGNKSVLNCYVGTSGGNKLCFQALTVSASPNSLSATKNIAGTSTLTTGSTTATVTGGSGSYTYAWSMGSVSGGGPITVNSPSAATTSFSASVNCTNQSFAYANLLVTDTVTSATANTSVFVQFFDTYSGC